MSALHGSCHLLMNSNAQMNRQPRKQQEECWDPKPGSILLTTLPHYEIWKYCQSTSRGQVEEPQNLRVPLSLSSPSSPPPPPPLSSLHIDWPGSLHMPSRGLALLKPLWTLLMQSKRFEMHADCLPAVWRASDRGIADLPPPSPAPSCTSSRACSWPLASRM